MRRRVLLLGCAAAGGLALLLALSAPAPEWPDRIRVRSAGLFEEDWDTARSAPDGDPLSVEFVVAWDETVFLRARPSWVRRALDWVRERNSPTQFALRYDALYDRGDAEESRGDGVWVEFVRRDERPAGR